MPAIRGITISVGYDDLLSITLRRNMRHMKECLVVTHPSDHRTKDLVLSVDGASLYETTAFYEHGAKFNKGLAMELGFESMGRSGWMLVWDADILFPEVMNLDFVDPGNLYTPQRRILANPNLWREDIDWASLSVRPDVEFAGYFQLFHADDPVLRNRPWYGIDYSHCGGCDYVFQEKWPSSRKIRPGFEVLHIGPCDTNWFGRSSERSDGEPVPQAAENLENMERFLRMKGWGRAMTGERIDERVVIHREALPRFS